MLFKGIGADVVLFEGRTELLHHLHRSATPKAMRIYLVAPHPHHHATCMFRLMVLFAEPTFKGGADRRIQVRIQGDNAGWCRSVATHEGDERFEVRQDAQDPNTRYHFRSPARHGTHSLGVGNAQAGCGGGIYRLNSGGMPGLQAQFVASSPLSRLRCRLRSASAFLLEHLPREVNRNHAVSSSS